VCKFVSSGPCSDYLPDSVKARIYHLYTIKGWDISRLGDHFGLRTDRVSAIINLKATEKDHIDTGRCVCACELCLAGALSQNGSELQCPCFPIRVPICHHLDLAR
jgi:hypothetical protein